MPQCILFMETGSSDITDIRGIDVHGKGEGKNPSSEEEIRICEEAFERSDYEKVG